MNSKLGWGLGLLVFALLVGGGLGLLLSRNATVPQLEPSAAPAVATQQPPRVATHQPKATANTNNAQTDNMTTPSGEDVTSVWEDKLNEILIAEGDEASKAAGILALMATAPEEGKLELSQHLVNMVQDENYSATAELLVNTNTSADVASVLMNDLLNRNNALKLPLLLSVAKTENHPLRGEAKDMLELFIQDDKGDNWAEWETAINDWLKENNSENTPENSQ